MSAANPISDFGSETSGKGRLARSPFGTRAKACEKADQSKPGFTTESGVPVGRRSAPRLRLAIPAKLVSLYDTHRCILIDLSCTGAKLGLEKPFAIGETGILEIAEKEIFCEVVRIDQGPNGGVNGLLFDPQLTEQEVLGVREFAERYELDELRGLRAEVRDWVEGTVRVRS